MTKDDIIRMAREATDHLPDADSIRLQGIVLLALDAGAAAEREACAKAIEQCAWPAWAEACDEREVFATAIRARGNT